MGGLGNQLFQAAHALSQGWKHNKEVLFTPNSFTPGQGRNTINYVNNVFRNLKFVDKIENLKIVSEPTFEYSGVNPLETNTSFYGYYQSTKNWFGYEEKIRNIFTCDESTIYKLQKKYPQLQEQNTLSIHIRRSEYLKLSEIHPTISLEYIEKAIELIGNYSTTFIFSDDHDWVKQNLNLDNSIYIDEEEDFLELWLMGLCQNHIISNSTFSWWGVFLNKNKNKNIIAPSVWFGPKGPNAKDIYEPYWTIIDVEYNQGKLNLKK